MNEEDILRITDKLLLRRSFILETVLSIYLGTILLILFTNCIVLYFVSGKVEPKKKKASHISSPNLKKDETLLPSSTKLLRAPSKRKLKSQLKLKRKLFQDSEQEQLIDEMGELIPTVMKKLQKEKLVVDFCQLLRLISEEKLPLQNIALHLLFDVVRWYSVNNTSKMFYSDSCIKF
jgi:hypothetical protein